MAQIRNAIQDDLNILSVLVFTRGDALIVLLRERREATIAAEALLIADGLLREDQERVFIPGVVKQLRNGLMGAVDEQIKFMLDIDNVAAVQRDDIDLRRLVEKPTLEYHIVALLVH